MKSTKSVLLSLILITSLSGCATIPNPFGEKVKPIEVKKVEEPRQKLGLVPPQPLNLKPPSFIIIHPENVDKIWKQLEENKQDQVIFGLTDEDYELLALMMAEIRNFVMTQRLIIEQYKKYYEPETKQETKTESKK